MVENYGIVSSLKICQTDNGSQDEKKRCTHCHSLNTKKHGFISRSPLTKRGRIRAKTQRFYCKDCRRSFASSFSGKRSRHAPELIKEALVLSIDNHLSLREAAGKLGVYHQSISNWIRKYGSKCMSSAQINQRPKPYWSGILGIDGKPIKLFAKDYVLLHRHLAVKEHFKASYQKRVIRSLEQHFHQLMVHHFHTGIPRDNNITENIIKQLNKKLKSAESFKAKESAVNYIKLWFAYYKFKKFRASKETHRNGKSPLELALVTLPDKRWLDYCAKV